MLPLPYNATDPSKINRNATMLPRHEFPRSQYDSKAGRITESNQNGRTGSNDKGRHQGKSHKST
jgi:hypothetical protein